MTLTIATPTPMAGDAWVAYELTRRGYPMVVALRIACTPPMTVNVPAPDHGARPGREIQEAVDSRFGDVIRMVAVRLISTGELPREAIQ
jgi:hypothetical protein